MEPSPGCVRRLLHSMIRRTTRRLDAWAATADKLVDVHPTSLAGIALGFARLLSGVLAEASAMAPKSTSSARGADE